MKKSRVFALTALVVSLPTLAGENLPALGGSYRVRGECHQRTADGEYKRCVAWNQLVLTPSAIAGSYRYTLETNTFATTQGGCSLEGMVLQETKGNHLYLIATSDGSSVCPIRFKVDKKTLTLDMPAEQADSPACRNSCSSNASLYTDPFPRASRKK